MKQFWGIVGKITHDFRCPSTEPMPLPNKLFLIYARISFFSAAQSYFKVNACSQKLSLI